MICVSGGRECDGCTMCQPVTIYRCDLCGEDIMEGESYWIDIWSGRLCGDCYLTDENNAQQYDRAVAGDEEG